MSKETATKTSSRYCVRCQMSRYRDDAECAVCGYAGQEPHMARAVLLALAFIATGMVGYALVPFYVKAVGRKGDSSVVILPWELLVPGILPKIAVMVGVVFLAHYLGLALFGHTVWAWVAMNWLFIDIVLRPFFVLYHLTSYRRKFRGATVSRKLLPALLAN